MPTLTVRFCAWLLWLTTVMPQIGWAHASLLETHPGKGSVMAEPPSVISLRFNEPVSPIRMQLIDGNGNVIALSAPAATNNMLTVAPQSVPGDGQYIFSYRVLSSDAHPISGSIGFAIGDMPAPEAGIPAATDPVLEAVIRIVRTVFLLSVLGVTGLALYPILFLLPAGLDRPRRRAMLISGATALLSVMLGLGLWGVLLAEGTLPDLFSSDAWTLANNSTLARSTALITLGMGIVLWAATNTASRLMNWVAAGGALLGIIGMISSGHAAGNASLLLTPVFLLHILMAGIWFGALWLLYAMTGGGTETITLAETLRQFSSRATVLVIVLLICAGILGWHQLDAMPSFLFTTDYGRWLLLKLALVIGVLVLAALNRWRHTPALEREGKSGPLRKSIRSEIILMGFILAVTTVLASTPPPQRPLERLSYTLTSRADASLKAELVLIPGHVGLNTVEISFSNNKGALMPPEVTLHWASADAGIEPLKQMAEKTMEGVYRVADVNLMIPGKWEIRIETLIDDFTLRNFETTLTIE